MQRLLDELTALIAQIEVSIRASRTWRPPASDCAANEASTRQIMEGIGTILDAVGTSGKSPEVVDRVRDELAVNRLAAWSSTSPVFYHVRNTRREDFNDFEIVVLLLENRLAGGNVAAQILDHYYLNMVTCCSFRNRIPQVARTSCSRNRAARDFQQTRPVRMLNLPAHRPGPRAGTACE